MANDDLLDFQTGSEKTKTNLADIFSQTKSQMKATDNVAEQNNILLATLDSVSKSAAGNEDDLKANLDQLFKFLDEMGLHFEGFKKLNDVEQKLIDSAHFNKKKADENVIAAENALATVAAIGEYSLFSPSTWWKSKKMKKANAAVTDAKNDQTAADAATKQAEEDAETMFRERLNKSDMKEGMDQVSFVCQKAIDQIQKREAEIEVAEEELLKTLDAGNKVHIKALKQKEAAEEELEKTMAAFDQSKGELELIADKQSEEFTTKLQETRELEKSIEEWKAKINVCMAIAESKSSFEKKHNLTLKTLTSQKGDMKAMRGKLKSDLEARVSYYEAYLTIMKAGNDQKLMEYLEKIGVKTDEDVANTIAEMYVASNKARQGMMAAIPIHNKRLAAILATLHKASEEIQLKDAEMKKDFENMNGITVNSLFDNFSQPTGEPGNGATPNVKKVASTSGTVDELLS